MSVCFNCPRRTAEPNCHNAETCPEWAKEEAAKAERYRKKKEQIMLDDMMVHYDKGSRRYIPGVHPFIKKKKGKSL